MSDLACKDSSSVYELILVFDMMLDSSANKPNRAYLALDKETSACVDGDLSQLRILNVVVCCPDPVVLHVKSGCRFGDVEGEE